MGHWNPCFADCGISAVGLGSAMSFRGRRVPPEEAGPTSSQPGARHRNTAHYFANGWHPSRDEALPSSDRGTRNCIIFNRMPPGMSIPDRVASPGAHGGFADRYERFWLMTCPWGPNFDETRLPGGHPPGRLGAGPYYLLQSVTTMTTGRDHPIKSL